MSNATSATTPAQSAVPAHVTDHYKMGRTLGAGSFGKVKLAEHRLTGTPCAIKIMKRQNIAKARLDEKVQREIKISSQLHHPNIIRIYETIQTSEEIYVVLEYAQGGELFDYITERGRLEEKRAREFFQQLIAGIEACHRKMVSHRDIKPENLLLDKCNRIKIADFGLSNVMKDGHFLRTSCGSPQYAAPEIVSGQLYAGPEVDVWSCGVVLFAMLCGSLPFDDENIPKLFKKIRSGRFHMPTHLHPHAKDLIHRMLVVDPVRRITVQDIWDHPWFKVGLPPYLLALRTERAAAFSVDEKVLRQCVSWRLGTRDEVLSDLHTKRMSPASVAYHLLVDRENPCGKWECTDDPGQAKPGSMKDGPGEAPGRDLGDMQLVQGMHGEKLSDEEKRRRHQELLNMHWEVMTQSMVARKWRLGVRTNRLARQVVADIHAALTSIGASWKHGGRPYNYKCMMSLRRVAATPTTARAVAVWGLASAATASASAAHGSTLGSDAGGGMEVDSVQGLPVADVRRMSSSNSRRPSRNGTSGSGAASAGGAGELQNGKRESQGVNGVGSGPRRSSQGAGLTVRVSNSGAADPRLHYRLSPDYIPPTPDYTPSGPHVLKFQVQVYKLRPGNYVIDIARLEGHPYHFLEVAGDLCMLLQRAQVATSPRTVRVVNPANLSAFATQRNGGVSITQAPAQGSSASAVHAPASPMTPGTPILPGMFSTGTETSRNGVSTPRGHNGGTPGAPQGDNQKGTTK